MSGKDWLGLAALLLSPVVAVVIGQLLQNSRARRDRREGIFRTLMATRATPIHFDRVRALNMIDVEFHKDRKVREAWRTYFEFLEKPAAWSPAWQEKSVELFVRLLQEMAKLLGYDMPETDIPRRAYIPQGHNDLDADSQKIRKAMVGLTEGTHAIPVAITSIDLGLSSSPPGADLEEPVPQLPFNPQQPTPQQPTAPSGSIGPSGAA